MAGSHGSIRTNCLCSAASQSALTSPLPLLWDIPLTSLIKPKEPVTQSFSLTSDVPYLEKIHPHALAPAVTWVCSQDEASWSAGSDAVFLISLFMKAPSCWILLCCIRWSAYDHWGEIPVYCANKLWTAPFLCWFPMIWYDDVLVSFWSKLKNVTESEDLGF